MLRKLKFCAVIGSAVLLCNCANLNSIYRTTDFDRGTSVVTDAKQRLIINRESKPDEYFVGRRNPDRIVCAEPSPDVANSVSTALSLAIQSAGQTGNIGGSLGLSSTTAIAQLGERIATIQLLRDELADLCRSYANGAVSATSYTLRLSRLDDKMVTLLMGEMAAGAFGRELATTGGSATAAAVPTASAEEVSAARDKVVEKAGEISQKEEELTQERSALEEKQNQRKAKTSELEQSKSSMAALPDNAENAEKKKALKTKIDSLESDIQGLDTAITGHNTKVSSLSADVSRLQAEYAARLQQAASMEFANATSLASARGLGNPGSIIFPRGFDGPNGGSIALLQRNYLDQDKLGTLLDACISALDLLPIARARLEANSDLSIDNTALDQAERELERAERTRDGFLDDANAAQRDFLELLAKFLNLRVVFVENEEELLRFYTEETFRNIPDPKNEQFILPGEEFSRNREKAIEYYEDLKRTDDTIYSANASYFSADRDVGSIKRRIENLRLGADNEAPISKLGEQCDTLLPELKNAVVAKNRSLLHLREKQLETDVSRAKHQLEKAKIDYCLKVLSKPEDFGEKAVSACKNLVLSSFDDDGQKSGTEKLDEIEPVELNPHRTSRRS